MDLLSRQVPHLVAMVGAVAAVIGAVAFLRSTSALDGSSVVLPEGPGASADLLAVVATVAVLSLTIRVLDGSRVTLVLAALAGIYLVAAGTLEIFALEPTTCEGMWAESEDPAQYLCLYSALDNTEASQAGALIAVMAGGLMTAIGSGLALNGERIVGRSPLMG